MTTCQLLLHAAARYVTDKGSEAGDIIHEQSATAHYYQIVMSASYATWYSQKLGLACCHCPLFHG